MPRVDDYFNAKKIAVEQLSGYPFNEIAACSDFEVTGGNTFTIPFLTRTYQASFPDFTFFDVDDAEAEVPILEQVLILHYMVAMQKVPVSGEWIAYREIPGAAFYYSTFVKRAIDPLKKVFGSNTGGLSQSAEKIGGTPIDNGDVGYEFSVLPKVPLQLILWEGDEEFAPEANILFDCTVGSYLSPEDAVWLAGMVVYRLIALSKSGK
ncbi:MAG: DUF3786 domain-containing protein [Desulfobacterales bacterium]|nr:DUF3786 domain-containing protein [Desulfobacterales bacterium]